MTDEVYEGKRALQSFRQNNRRISEKAERIRALREAATRSTPSLEAERVSGTGDRSRVEAVMIRVIDLERQLDDAIDRLNAERYRIQDAIDRMADAREQRLLELRYIDGRSWVSVMTRMGISERMSFLLHERALRSFSEVYFSDCSKLQ